MTKDTRKLLALGMCLVLVAGSFMGCATGEETVREHPKTVIGAGAGAAGGALLGGLLFRSTTGAVVGGLLGGLAGGLVGNGMEAKKRDYDSTAQEYSYASAQGTVVRIEQVEVEPASIRPGEKVNLIAHYALLTPYSDQRVTVTERWDISRGGQHTGNPEHTVQRQGGTWASAVPLTLPTNARTGTYRVALTVQAAGSSDSATASFTVR